MRIETDLAFLKSELLVLETLALITGFRVTGF